MFQPWKRNYEQCNFCAFGNPLDHIVGCRDAYRTSPEEVMEEQDGIIKLHQGGFKKALDFYDTIASLHCIST